MEQVREGYLDIVRKTDNAVLIDGTEAPELVHLKIREALVNKIPTAFGI